MWQATKNYYHLGQAIIANVMYGFPARGMKIIGVTGTDGKTTTANILYHVLHSAGEKAAVISSVGATIDGTSSDIGFHVTTPGRFAIQSYLRDAKKAGVNYVVLEITSHALDQHRAYGIPFTVGVITNVTREHLDYHKTYEKYVKAKSKLLRVAKTAIINKDDHSYWQIRKHELKNKTNIITYGMKKDSDVNPHSFPFTTKLLGQFNKYNSLAAIAALQVLKIPEDKIRKGIASFKPPVGRQEIVYKKDFMVINDFAHTPNSFAEIIPEIKKLTENRLIHVFGSAAKRDKYKRPEMGAISAKSSDIIVLTSEDPRDEPIQQINSEILAGIRDPQFEIVQEEDVKGHEFLQYGGKKGTLEKKKFVFVIPDRKKAITFAIGLAKRGDVILLTGKGHEKSMNYGNGEEPWNESEAALEAIKMRGESK